MFYCILEKLPYTFIEYYTLGSTYAWFSHIHAWIILDLLKTNHKVHKNASNWTVSIAHYLASLYIRTDSGSCFGNQDVQFDRVFGFWYITDSRVKASQFYKAWYTNWDYTFHGLAWPISIVHYLTFDIVHYVISKFTTLLNFGNRIDVLSCFTLHHFVRPPDTFYFDVVIVNKKTTKFPF